MKRMKWTMLVSLLLACMLLSACTPKAPEGSQGLELYPTGIQIIQGGDFLIDSYECEVLGIGSFEGSELVIPATHTFDDLAEEIMKSAKEKGDRERMEQAKNLLKSFAVVHIKDQAFEGCTQLTSVIIPDSVRSIGSSAFAGCSNLQSVVLPDSIEDVSGNAFDGCPDSLFTEYENGMYLGSESNPYLVLVRLADVNATSFAIHQDTKLVADAAFAECEALLELAIPNNSIIIPKGSFDSCIHIQTADLPQAEGLEYVLNDDGASYSVSGIGSCEMVYFSVPTEHEGLPVTGIADGSLAYDINEYDRLSKNYRHFLRMKRQEGMSEEEASKLFAQEYGSEFFDMQKLEVVEIIVLHSGITSISDNAFAATMKVLLEKDNPEYIVENGCIIHAPSRSLIRGSQEGIIPEYIVRIGADAFNGFGIEHIVIPDSVTDIGDRAFSYCEPKTIVIGSGVTNIGTDAFAYCESAWYVQNKSEVDLFATNHEYSIFGTSTLIVDEAGELLPNENQWSATYVLTNDGFYYRKGHAEDIGIEGTKEYTLLAYIGSDQTLTLPLTLEGKDYALSCFSTFAEHIVIPDGVESIYSSSFASCDMSSVTIPESVKVIEKSAFNDCDGLKDVYYSGTQEEWESISIDEHANQCLLNATIHYNQ